VSKKTWRTLVGVAGVVLAAAITAWAIRSSSPTGPGQQIPGSIPEAQEPTRLSLSVAPDTWGKTVPGASGQVLHADDLQGAFTGKVELRGLEPNHQYVLSINGKPPHPSDSRLPQRVNDEGYADFKQVSTDSDGNVNDGFSVSLPSGQFDVNFFVKDATDFKIVLYSDFLQFAVR